MKNIQTFWAPPVSRSLTTFLLIIAATFMTLPGMASAQNVGDGAGSGPNFNNPRGIAQESDGQMIVADFGTGNIFRVNAETGDRVLLSDSSSDEQGPRLSAPAGVVVLDDGRIFVTALNRQAVYEIDAVNGSRTLLAGEDGSILSPFGLASGVLNGKVTLVVADTGRQAGGDVIGPVLVDPDTGEVSLPAVKADNAILYNDPRSVAVLSGELKKKKSKKSKKSGKSGKSGKSEKSKKGKKLSKNKFDPKNGTIVVGNFGSGELIAVRAKNGKRVIISKSSGEVAAQVGNGPDFNSISDIAIANSGTAIIVMDLGNDALLGVDLATGDRTAISRTGTEPVGGGDDFRAPHGIEVLSSSFMVTDFGVPGLTRVEDDGTRTFVSTTPLDGFVGIRAISLTAGGNILAADFAGNRIFSVAPSGVRTMISGLTSSGAVVGSGPNFAGPVAAIELPDGRIAVAQFQNTSVMYFVDPVTGDRSELQGPGRGTGPALASRGFILDPTDTSRLLATSFALQAVVAVDWATGNRTVLSADGTRGAGPALTQPLGIAVDPADGTIYVSDLGASGGAVFRIDAASGDRTLVTTSNDDGIGDGVPFGGRPFGVSFIDGQILAVTTDVLLVNGADGNRTLLSEGSDNLFSIRDLDADNYALSNFGSVQGIQTVDKVTGARTTLSNATNP